MRFCCCIIRPGIPSTRFTCCRSWSCSGPASAACVYALALTVLCLAEHPVYVNLIGLGQQPTLLLIIICARTVLLDRDCP